MSAPDPFGADIPTALYRCYDASGALLYVGITGDLRRRINGHRGRSPWWKACTDRTAEWYPSRPEALTAERAAITAESPLHNRMRPRLFIVPGSRKARELIDPYVAIPRPDGPTRPLYDARRGAGLTLAGLSRQCGARGLPIGPRTLAQFECGVSLPWPRVVPVLTEVLGIDVAEIYIRLEDERAA